MAVHSLPLVTPPPLRPCPAVPAGYECEPYNNPADFFLDIINGDSTAVAMSKADETDTGMKHGAEENYHSVDFARGCPAQHKKITDRCQTTNNHAEHSYGYFYS